MSRNDPADSALAAIASILVRPRSSRDAAKDTPPAGQKPEVADAPIAPALPEVAHGYSKVGPGPMAAIRFKWTVREDNGIFFVDETIGENSPPIVSGPMDKGAAIKLVDDRESDARQRFENLKREMAGLAAAADPARNDGGKA